LEIKQGSSFRVPIKLVLSSDSSEKTGVAFGSVSCKIQKQAGSSASKTVDNTNWFEIDSGGMPGVYDLLLSASDTDTVGFLKYSISVSSCKVYSGLIEIVANVESDTYTKVNTYLDATVSSRLPTSSYTAPDNATVGTINTKLGTPASSVSADIAAVKVDTGSLSTGISSILAVTTLLKKYEEGRWKIHLSGGDANRLILYDTDNTTPLIKFDLKDSSGSATFINPFERTPV
jgi:hypothetical protein